MLCSAAIICYLLSKNRNVSNNLFIRIHYHFNAIVSNEYAFLFKEVHFKTFQKLHLNNADTLNKSEILEVPLRYQLV